MVKPVVAIIGQPNVGKSSLFNRLAHQRKAIVIDQPGATRDRNYAACTWNDKPYLLIDTGGFEPAATEGILVQIREQTQLALEESDIIIFLMDGREGLMPADRDIAALLRGFEKPVFYAINKIDGLKLETLAYEFYQLGMETIYPVSAEHGLGVGELMDEAVRLLPAAPEPESSDAEDRIRIAVIGKPNVGKSSLINRILGYERTIVDPVPGTTRDAIDTPFTFAGRPYLLVDTAGIRRKSRVSLTLEKYSVIQAIKAISRCDIALMLIDAEEGVTEQDAKIAGLALENGTACIVVVNKWDAVEKDDRTIGKYVREIKDKMKFLDFAPILFVSARTGQRVVKIFDAVNAVYSQYTRRVSTPELNRKVQEFLAANPPPQYRSRSNPFNYVSQVAVKPPTFVFFVGDPRSVHFSYERYLMNQFREALALDQVPLRFFFKKKSKDNKG
ncbi:MAG: ribosome biogenesis GTPase Der [Deltaproteobacteria bacterium HGW-Deltaproteobacteria-11]|nr:MAG: ribosome biogenesis GTPase Der [Deltaproteobacteria bacterium HGW-Deltaproteobacteria-11]